MTTHQCNKCKRETWSKLTHEGQIVCYGCAYIFRVKLDEPWQSELEAMRKEKG